MVPEKSAKKDGQGIRAMVGRVSVLREGEFVCMVESDAQKTCGKGW